MFTTEDFESWNDLFPQCQMREDDLKHPTETFLVKALVHYLRMFGLKVEPPFPLRSADVQDNSREKRLFLIKLAHQVDHFLKITDKSYHFYYYDILNPTPKKTSHMLGILLNYLYYYNMYKTDVFNMANDKMKKRQETLDTIKKIQEQNEQGQNKAINLKVRKTEILEMLPKKKKSLEILKKEFAERKQQFQHLEVSTMEVITTLDKLLAEKDQLNSHIVPEKESRDLQIQTEKYNERLKEIKDMECSIKLQLTERNDHMKMLQELIELLENVKDIYQNSLLQESKKIHKILKTTKAQRNTIEKELGEAHLQYQQLKDCIKELKAKHTLFKTRMAKEKDIRLSRIELLTREFEVKEDLLEDTLKEQKVVVCDLEEQEDIHEYLKEKIAELNLFLEYNYLINHTNPS